VVGTGTEAAPSKGLLVASLIKSLSVFHVEKNPMSISDFCFASYLTGQPYLVLKSSLGLSMHATSFQPLAYKPAGKQIFHQ